LFPLALSTDTKLTGFAIFGTAGGDFGLAGDAAGGFYGSGLQPLSDLVAAGWLKTWPFEDPLDGSSYPIAWGSDSESAQATTTPSHGVSIVFGVWTPYPSPGAPYGATQHTASFSVGRPPGVRADAIESAYPHKVKITGKVWARIGRSKGLDSRDLYPSEHDVTVGVIVIPFANGTWEPSWLGDGIWSALGRTLGSKSLHIAAEGGAVSADFEFECPYNEFAFPYGVNGEDAKLEIAVQIWDPLGRLRELDSRGAPYMLANTGMIEAGLSDIKLFTSWLGGPQSGYFCTPTISGGGTNEQRICEGVALDHTLIVEMVARGQQWSCQLQNAYIPGTVEITVDGTVVKPALDFIEASPDTGVITFLNSFSYAKELRVCYFPFSDPTVDPPATYLNGQNGLIPL
jgi:hypothetical protein